MLSARCVVPDGNLVDQQVGLRFVILAPGKTKARLTGDEGRQVVMRHLPEGIVLRAGDAPDLLAALGRVGRGKNRHAGLAVEMLAPERHFQLGLAGAAQVGHPVNLALRLDI